MSRHMKRIVSVALAALFAAPALAQYPARPVRMIVSIPPGGAPDIAARVLGQRLSESIGQQVVVDNRPGSNGNIAAEILAKSAPDGHTLGLFADSLITINPHIYAKMPVDTLKDLAPLASVAANQFVLSVNPVLPVKTFKEFVEHARRANPPLAYASGGNGSQHQMCMEMLKQRAGINLIHVPFKGGTPATIAADGGDDLAWPVRAGQHAARSARPLARRGGKGNGPTRLEGKADGRRRVGCLCHYARGICCPHTP